MENIPNEVKIATKEASTSQPGMPPSAVLNPDLSQRDPQAGGVSFPVLGTLLYHLYGFPSRHWRALILKMLEILEGGHIYSLTLRRIFKKYYAIEVGLFSSGGCFVPGNLNAGPQGIKIGRYCSFALSMHSFNANHPMNLISSHALFYNPALGFVDRDIVPRTRLEIGNDVWIGYNAIILSTVKTIGDGAVIGAGAVVNQNVPPYAVVVGNPARVVRYRFGTETIQALQASRWWENSPQELKPELDKFRQPLEGDEVR
jgi:acetyltransferase-like isoleucine patch superfamily enzyme